MKTILALIAMAVMTSASAKEINLACSYTNVKGGTNTTTLYINTDTSVGTAKDSSDIAMGRLVTTEQSYAFTVGDSILAFTYGVNRHTLQLTLISNVVGNQRTMMGTCEPIVTKPRI